MNKTISLTKKSFLISLIYVGLGTICVLPILNNTFLDGDWLIFVLFLTLPVNFISVGIMYAEPDAIGLILVVQVAYFLLFWFIIYRILKQRNKKEML